MSFFSDYDVVEPDILFIFNSKNGVREYWIIDPAAESAALYSLKNKTLDLKKTYAKGEILQSEIVTGFNLALKDIF